MTVEWRCPECGARTFAPPAGSPGALQYKCRIHTETNLVQMEQFSGPNFAYVDEDEINLAKTGVQTFGTMASRINPVINATPVVPKLSDEEAAAIEKERLRDLYHRVTNGKVAHKQWGAPRLRKEIELEEQRLSDRIEYLSLADTYEQLSGERPAEQWGLPVLRSRVKILQDKADAEEQTEQEDTNA